MPIFRMPVVLHDNCTHANCPHANCPYANSPATCFCYGTATSRAKYQVRLILLRYSYVMVQSS